MKRYRLLRLLVVTSVLSLVVVNPASADTIRTKLTGYDETPLTLDTTGAGKFKARILSGGTIIDYELSYRDLESTVTQAHIHFGRPSIGGGIVLFLCTNLGNAPTTVPTPQPCPATPATITGMLTAADVIAVPVQGIASGAAGFAEILRAIRAGAAYVNVHTTGRPGGEIRGPLDGHDHDDD
jgi:CHRD domain-containing protein